MPIQHTPVRARDLRHNIKELGFEKGTVTTIELFLDEFIEHRQHMREMVELLVECVNRVEVMIKVGENMHERIKQIEREQDDASE
jgi:uncharacterized protein Yka (UPF0111/DUF47 family)